MTDSHDPIDHRCIVVAWHETGTDTLNLMRSGLTTREDCRIHRFDGK